MATPRPILLQVRNAIKTYARETADAVPVLRDMNLTIYAGEWLYILGGNGCGKSTLLKAIAGRCTLDAGNILFSNSERPTIHWVESDSQMDLVSTMTIYENLALLNPHHRNAPRFSCYRNKNRAIHFAETLRPFGLGLENRLHDQICQLSSGQQQAVVAARALLSGASIILLDEFTSALDRKTAPVILNILREHSRCHGVTIIVVTHDYYWIDHTADRVALMDGGVFIEILIRRKSGEEPDSTFTCQGEVQETIVSGFTSETIMERLYGVRLR